MGLAGWFGAQSEEEHIRSLHFSFERGVDFVDTARIYGESERILGAALASWSGPRPFVATKVSGLRPPLQWGTPTSVDDTYPRGHIRRDCEISLRTLGLDRIDLLQLHTYWASWGVDGHWLDELRALKAESKVAFIGVSIPDHRSDMALELVRSDAIDAVQTVVNIFDPHALELLIPACIEHDVAVIARCILDEGGLTGFLTPEMSFAPGDFRDGYFDLVMPRDAYIAKVDRLRRYIPEVASSLASLAVRFVLHSPGVTTAIASMHVMEHASANIAALDEGRLPDEVFEDLFLRHRFTKNLSEYKIFGSPEP
jgi:aryl-alcohol dehydrogenase-like predicted oxidoreductase